VLVLDEPTAALSDHEASRLFEIVNRMKSQGVAIIYIAHRLDEVSLVADRVQVLRDGRSVLAEPVKDVSKRDIVAAMVGRKVGEISRPSPPEAEGPVALSLSAASADGFRDVSLQVHVGEVVALYGKLGSGTAAVVEALYGLRPVRSGTIVVGENEAAPATPNEAIDAGFGLVPADRKGEGGFAVRSASENLAAPSWPKMASWGILGTGPETAAYRRWQDQLSIASPGGPGQAFATLSGGNQQKVVIARWFERGALKLLMVEPTRGVDVGARAEIYAAIRRCAREGTAVLIATSDYEEVIQVADRAIVFARGEVVAELAGDQITGEALLTAAGG
jgi:ribose transport system ATP-binding protein